MLAPARSTFGFTPHFTFRSAFQLAMILVATLFLSACLRQAPVLNVSDRAFPDNVAQKLTLDEVAGAIAQAGIGRQDEWRFDRISDNLIMADITVRNKHTARVRIPFSTESFSIQYEDSTGLLYDGAQIHRNYNKWIGHLSSDIYKSVTQLASLK